MLAVGFSRSLLVVSDLKATPLPPGLEASVLRFLADVVLALEGSPVLRRETGYFRWPLVAGADASAERGEQALAGYLRRLLIDCQPRCVLLLGASAQRYVSPPPDAVVLHAEPLGRLFSNPALKADLWRQLQPHCRRAT